MKFESSPLKTDTLTITSGFGGRDAPVEGASTNHRGVDIAAFLGTPVLSVAAGKVSSIINDTKCGLGIVVDHGGSNLTTYCHLSKQLVAANASVSAGQQIGSSGQSGTAVGPHLHFMYQINEIAQDPTPYLQSISTVSTDRSRIATTPAVVSKFNGSKQSISPYIGTLESFHPNIQYELTRRQQSIESINSHSPFVKLTSLVKVFSKNLTAGGEAYFPSLGVHGESRLNFDDIYFPRANRSIVAYATTQTGNTITRVPVVVEAESDKEDPQSIPVPGITDVKITRNLAGGMGVRGGLMRATISIAAYSINQVNTLLTYFLRPTTKVVLELGRTSSSPSETPIVPYNWNRKRESIIQEMNELALLNTSQTEFIEKYIYGNNGNYELYFCTMVNVDIKFSNNLYTLTATVQSVQQFEMPNRHTGIESTCASVDDCRAIDIHQYFSPESSNKMNTFQQLIAAELEKGSDQIISFAVSDKSSAESETTTTSASDLFGAGQHGYFVSWNFFVEKILNDENAGIMSVFPSEDKIRLSFLNKGMISSDTLLFSSESAAIRNKEPNLALLSNEVGYHPNLRSTDPSVMIIVNKDAQTQDAFNQYSVSQRDIGMQTVQTDTLPAQSDVIRANSIFRPGPEEQKMLASSIGDFSSGRTVYNTAFLTHGVWINSNAIIQAFLGTDTVTAALNLLLSRINTATQGYWNLQLLSDDKHSPGLHVIDYGLSKKTNLQKQTVLSPEITSLIESNPYGLNPTMFANANGSPKYLYQFNKKSKITPVGGIGSEVIGIELELGMPQVIAIQAIAGIGGAAEKGTLQVLDLKELSELSVLDLKPGNCAREPQPCKEPTLAEMLNLGNPYGDPKTISAAAQKYALLGSSIKFIELDPARLMKLLNLDSTETTKTHAFSSSNLTKTTVTVTLPGIGGIELFQSFLVDRVPAIVQLGYYTVTEITHSFSTKDGWITIITGRFRYNPQ